MVALFRVDLEVVDVFSVYICWFCFRCSFGCDCRRGLGLIFSWVVKSSMKIWGFCF